MKKIFSIFVLAALTTGAMADYWFVDPAATSDEATGYSWDDALSPSAMCGMMSLIFDGDTMFIKGGTISIKTLTDLWEIKNGVTIIGGLDPNLSGTDVVIPTYPSATPTIFDGDANGNGKPDAGDAEALIRVDLSKNQEATFVLQGVVLRNTYHYLEGEATKDTATYNLTVSALRLMCGTAFVKNCEMYNNFTKNRGSQTVTVLGANAHFMDCEMHHGVSESRGGLIRARDYFMNGTSASAVHPSVVIERCALHESSALGGKKINANGPYGGAVHASTGELFVINSTFVLDSCYSKGGALRGNDAGITIISCTFGQNFGTRVDTAEAKPNSYGSSIGLDGNVPIRFMNTIVVDDKDKGNKATAPVLTDGNTITADQFFFSNGYNIMGGCLIYVGQQISESDFNALWMASDSVKVCKNNDFTARFGDVYTNLKDNGGCSKTILPKHMLKGAPVSELQDYADQYCPDWTSVDASVDQRGYKRDEDETCVGAAALEATKPTAIKEVQSATCNLPSATFSILGMPVGEDYKGIVIQKGQKYIVK